MKFHSDLINGFPGVKKAYSAPIEMPSSAPTIDLTTFSQMSAATMDLVAAVKENTGMKRRHLGSKQHARWLRCAEMYMRMGNHTKATQLLQKIEDAEAESGGEDNALEEEEEEEEEEEVVEAANETINAALDDGVDDEAGIDNETDPYVEEL